LRLGTALIVSAFLAGSGDVFAEELSPAATLTGADAGTENALRPNINCTCRFRGQDFSIGESVCIRGSLATCSTFLNNTSWSFSKTPCPVALLDIGQPPRRLTSAD
jgi:hypothetical protein